MGDAAHPHIPGQNLGDLLDHIRVEWSLGPMVTGSGARSDVRYRCWEAVSQTQNRENIQGTSFHVPPHACPPWSLVSSIDFEVSRVTTKYIWVRLVSVSLRSQ